jgi:putative membrane protein
MTLRMVRTLQALILAGLGIFLLNKIWSGQLYWYINARFLPLTILGLIGLLWLAQAQLRDRPPQAGGHEHGHHPPSGGDDHQHAHIGLPALALLAAPIVLGVLVPAAPLTADAIANRGLSQAAPLSAGGPVELVQFHLAPEERTILDWLRAFDQADDPSAFAGEPADVTGFVYQDARAGEEHFMVARFTLTCCVADASAIAMLVDWTGASALAANSWVRVRGPVRVASFEGRPMPLVKAETVEAISPPDQPYLYP